MFGMSGNNQKYSCPACSCGQTMTYGGEHGIRLGGVTGVKGAALDYLGGQIGASANEFFEKKLSTEIFICESCGKLEFRYMGGL